MEADRNDRYQSSPNDNTGRRSTQTIVMAIAVLILAGGAYLLSPDESNDAPQNTSAEPVAPVVPAQAPKPQPAPQIAAAPDIPAQSVDDREATATEVEVPPPPPPTPEEIDAQLREGIAETTLTVPEELKVAYSAPYLLDRGISSIDQLARGLVPGRSLNLSPPQGKFRVSDEGQQRFIDPAGYTRYDALVSAITALPTETLAAIFHRFRPLLEDAYASLGYPAEQMDNTLIAALDQVISAPVLEGRVELETKGALYAFVDPQLENASDLHKQLMRTGPRNTQRLQAWAKTLSRDLLN